MVKRKKDKSAEEKILEAARKVFTRDGMVGARMQDIADEAGINKALLHYYFRDKEKLFETIFTAEAEKFFPKLNLIFQADLPLGEKVVQFVDKYIDQMMETPYLPWFVLNELQRDPDAFLQKVWGQANLPNPGLLLKQIQEEIQAGRIRAVNPMQLLLNLLSMTIFPFIARPMITRVMKVDDQLFQLAMLQRKKEIPEFFMSALRK